MSATVTENALDIRQLLKRLWRGKGWILGSLLLGVVVAAAYAALATPVWVAQATIDRPEISQVSNYYQQRLLLSVALPTSEESALTRQQISDEVYQEFQVQLASVNSQRAFWLHSDYLKQLIAKHPEQQSKQLERLIQSIKLLPGDTAQGRKDQIQLQATSARASSELLRQYIEFASQRAAAQLNQNLHIERQARIAQLQQQARLNRSVLAPDPTKSRRAQLTAAEAEYLEAWQPMALAEARLTFLTQQPETLQTFTTWRYLQTPQPPLTQKSPRLLLLSVMWGAIGALVGAGIAISRRYP